MQLSSSSGWHNKRAVFGQEGAVNRTKASPEMDPRKPSANKRWQRPLSNDAFAAKGEGEGGGLAICWARTNKRHRDSDKDPLKAEADADADRMAYK